MRRTRVPRKITRCTKLRGLQRSPELSSRSRYFRVPENLVFPALYYIFNNIAVKISPNQHAGLFRFLFTEDSLKIKKGLELVFRSHFSYFF